MSAVDTATAVLVAVVAWVALGLVVALLLGRVVKVADRLERRAASLESSVRSLPRQLLAKPRFPDVDLTAVAAPSSDADDTAKAPAATAAVAAPSAVTARATRGSGRRRAGR